MLHQIRSALLLGVVGIAGFSSPGWAHAKGDPILEAAQAAESRLKARVGLLVHDTSTGRTWRYRADERFPMASTAKVPICGALLQQGEAALRTEVHIQENDILSYAPTTKELVNRNVPASELCAITLRNSDNTAANGVLHVVGGPSAVTSFLRSIGDMTTRLDRNEPALNEGTPGDARDTTTPQAIAHTLQAMVLGAALSPEARKQLTNWLSRNEVGGPLLRAGVPSDWRVADRTGAAGFGTRGIVAIMWPPRREPVVAAVYLTETDASLDERDAAIASIGNAIATIISQ